MKTRTFVVTVVIPEDVDGSKAKTKDIVELLRECSCDINFGDCAFEVKEIKENKGVEK